MVSPWISLKSNWSDLLQNSNFFADSTIKLWPLCRTALTSKLTDTNNAAQPELSFQHQAVLAFRTQAQAQETSSSPSLNPLVDTINFPTRSESLPKHKASAIVNAEAEWIGSGEDEDTDGLPKSSKKRHITETSSTSKSKCIIPTTEDSDTDSGDEADEEPSRTKAKKSHASLGNPTNVDEDGLLLDVDVQLVHEGVPVHEDKQRDIDNFFGPAILKTVN
ncbi:hypothetical protein EDB89DRAFT_2063470 [Lactarius sanguifluus]|nr:hypothetical protein EDB89DRAFT_2076071 [Lactarius sanguifluus]KAH9178509.1 hypothetical protein EDB89DRAFT_2063470 [Lactarius sanguifluus]